MKPSFTFFCDANSSMGMGHYSRCKRVAKAISHHCKKLCNISFQGDLKPRLREEIVSLDWKYLNKNAAIDRMPNHIAIFDSYTITQSDLDYITSQHHAAVFIDDFNRHDFSNIDLVVNFRFGYNIDDYDVKRGCFGLEYFPADLDMVKVRKDELEKPAFVEKPIRSVLLYPGGLSNLSIQAIISAIDYHLSGTTILVLSGLSNQFRGLFSKFNLIQIINISDSINMVVNQADVVICSGGLIKYEAGFCLTPNACINQTIDQCDDTQILANANLTYNFGLEEELHEEPKNFITNMGEFFSIKTREEQKKSMKISYKTESINNITTAIIGLLA